MRAWNLDFLHRAGGVCIVLAAAILATAAPASSPEDRAGTRVVTWHYDNLRTGWNMHERTLTPHAVAGRRFKPIASVTLDDAVYAQPLVMTNQRINGKGVHDVVYVATENNTLYAIDANTGAVLRKHNFGPAVPINEPSFGCTNSGPDLGITSTPVIDATADQMYLMTDVFPESNGEYQLHKVDLASLEDYTAPATVTASATLSDGSLYTFDTLVTRQRPALLLANGNIYAGFGSFCDAHARRTRGWVLGYRAGDLSPLAANDLTNSRAHAPNRYFLTSVWMSGAGPAASSAGDVYFATGNSDRSGTTFSRTHNIEESAAQFSGDLTKLDGLFTPGGPKYGWSALDRKDNDFGSGGVMLLPPQAGQPSNLAVVLGKVGRMYLLNADDLDNGAHGNASAYDIEAGGPCWCAESYFEGPDGVGRVVSSGGNVVKVWAVETTPRPRLRKEFQTAPIDNGQDPGVFTTVSSNGTHAGSAVIWAVGQPVTFKPNNLKLYAFDAASGNTLFTGKAGEWPFVSNDATLTPVVANGHVYVASYETLTIFGLSDAPAARLAPVTPPLLAKLPPGEHEITGTVGSMAGPRLSIRRRDGREVTVDVSLAKKHDMYVVPAIGGPVIARGSWAPSGALMAQALFRAKPNPGLWYPDR